MKTIDSMIDEINGAIDGKMSPDRESVVRAILRSEIDSAEAIVGEFCRQKTIPRSINVPSALRGIIAARLYTTAEDSAQVNDMAAARQYQTRPQEWEALYGEVWAEIITYHRDDTAEWGKGANGEKELIIRRGDNLGYGWQGKAAVWAFFCNHSADNVFRGLGADVNREMRYMQYFRASLARCRAELSDFGGVLQN